MPTGLTDESITPIIFAEIKTTQGVIIEYVKYQAGQWFVGVSSNDYGTHSIYIFSFEVPVISTEDYGVDVYDSQEKNIFNINQLFLNVISFANVDLTVNPLEIEEGVSINPLGCFIRRKYCL